MSPFITLTLVSTLNDDVELTLNAVTIEAIFASTNLSGEAVTEVHTGSSRAYYVRETYEEVKERVAAGLRWEG